ncbi:MAG: tyrosine recombinase XerC [Oscillospiraceae bacterium]|nr:tyrosine recombinase XerC [Oscillospiraceae bacterium]
MNYQNGAPPVISRFLSYHETIKGHSKRTVDEYFYDLRIFFRFLKQHRGLSGGEFDEIDISDVDLELVKTVTLQDIYAYMSFLSRERGQKQAARARKVASIRSFFKYLTLKAHLLDENPVIDLDSPKLQKTLPRYLKLDECIQLLDSVSGRFPARDYCILTLFLNCGLRVSELCGLNTGDIKDDSLRVLGKGSKERTVYLNDACLGAISAYMPERERLQPVNEKALFLSQKRNRIDRRTVHNIVKKHLAEAGLDSVRYSSHKLRHSAATLMLQNGVDVRTLQELLGHENLNTTQIYTHIENTQLREAATANPLGREQRTENR